MSWFPDEVAQIEALAELVSRSVPADRRREAPPNGGASVSRRNQAALGQSRGDLGEPRERAAGTQPESRRPATIHGVLGLGRSAV